MRRRNFLLLSGGGLAAAGLAACGGSGGGGGEGGGSEVEVFTWWAQGSEKAGLDALVAQFEKDYPDLTFVNGSVAGGAGSAAKDMLQSRLQAGDPPDTFQAHAGLELADYVDAGQLEDVSDLYEEYGLTEAFPSDLVELLTLDDMIYSVPSNIHRSNVVWTNTAVLEAAGIDPTAVPADVEAFIADVEKAAASGVAGLSIGTTWTQVNLLEAVLMADLGSEAYNGLWTGGTDWSGGEVTTALEHFEALIALTNTDRDGLDWTDATQMQIDGSAAYSVMGDWAVASFQQAEMTDGEDYGYFPLSGGEPIFGFLADSFTLPVGAPNPDGAKAWLDTISSQEGQVAFSLAKGSIPARTDVDTAEFPAYQQTAIESYAQDAISPSLAHGAATPVAWLNDISDATSKFTTGASDVSGYQEELATIAESHASA
ncbi:ABC transporter substrate-binding protein [Brachybacterium saurashtrense]|uniref:Probable sugar-binding periplasmic protein n=1 Tax=Brachybacterium saurashtrense TaxID=556288 RepID=A0A345YQ70_9MICO|nr:extracellular solute-binding protein [Brachybacterium saurashtrense]AXK46072.1 extracellular solute-binding protein [Brachybacterium saurashtrense]RRR23812.1 extracellular solute-binding protein [Brachybacterium saurashtrense]